MLFSEVQNCYEAELLLQAGFSVPYKLLHFECTAPSQKTQKNTLTLNRLHVIISKKTEPFIATNARALKSTYYNTVSILMIANDINMLTDK
jgi:hypothetical protein